MKDYFATLLLFFLTSFQLAAQDNSYQTDTAKVNRLNEFAEKNQFTNPTEVIWKLQDAIALSKKINYNYGLSLACNLRAGLFFYEMKLDSCKQLLDIGYNALYGKTDPASKNQIATILNRYAAIYQRRNSYDSAVGKYVEAMNIFKATGDKSKIIMSYYNLAGIYKFLNDTTKMFLNARETDRLAAKTTDTALIVRGKIALADAFHFIKNYDSVLLIAKEGLDLAKLKQMTFAIGIFNNFTGLYFANNTSQYDTAISYYKAALQSFTEINTQYDIALVHQNLGIAYFKKKDYANAAEYSKQATVLARELNFDDVLTASLLNLVATEEKKGNIGESYKYLLQYVQINDSVQLRNNQKKVYDLETKYQEQKKEIELFERQKIIDRKSMLNYLLGGTAISVFLIGLLSFRNYRHRQQQQQLRIKELETEKQLTATEAVLKGEEQERTRLAKDLHDGLGGMLSGIKYSMNIMKGNLIMTPENAQAFERSVDMLDGSIKEMRRVAHNMMPESLVKFGLDTALKDFCNEINQTGALKVIYQSMGLENYEIKQITAITIYRIVQELINNTMKHAVAKTAIVQVTKSDREIAVTVEDDGKGFDAAILNNVTGMGWSNIKNRVEFLKGKLDVNSKIGKGTSVLIEINIK